MSRLIDALRSFNSKERFFLLGHLLGNPTLQPCAQFRQALSKVLQVQVPEKPFAAMDYHLDWLYASLHLALSDGNTNVFTNGERLIKGQQEDIDFLLAYEQEDVCHVVLLEAKGVTGWLNSQMVSKARRLGEIFGSDGRQWTNVVPHFALLSPNPPQRLQTEGWPAWMIGSWGIPRLRLPVPATLQAPVRCDKDGHTSKAGAFWRAARRRV